MPATNFSAACADREDVTPFIRTCAADSASTDARCSECEQLKRQISAHKRTVDDLTGESQRTRTDLKDLDVEMAALRDFTKSERSTAAHSADRLRTERDTLRDRLQEVSRHWNFLFSHRS